MIKSTLVITPRPSEGLLATVCLIHGLALIAAFANGLAYAIDLWLACCVISHFYFNLKYYYLTPKFRELELRADDRWLLFGQGAESIEADLLPETWVSHWLIILHLQTQQGKQTILLCRDSVDSEVFRLLRVRLHLTSVAKA